MDLSDFLPSDFRKDFASRNLKIGTVLRLSVKDTKPPKIKRFIVVGKTIDGLSLASVYINSHINLKVNWNIELQSLNIPLENKGNDFLDRDSFVDCSKLVFRDSNEISEIIQNNPQAVKGELKEEDLQLILETLRNSITIKGKYKKKYGLF